MGAKTLAHQRLNYTNAIFSSGLTHLNMNSYPRLTRFKYEIALNCVSPILNWRKSLPPLGEGSSARRGRRRCDCPFPLWGKVRMGAKTPARQRLNRTNAIFSSGLTHLNMNSYPRLTRFKYEIALNCVSPIGEPTLPVRGKPTLLVRGEPVEPHPPD